MAKKKSNSARKGKKAWRKISSEDIEDFNEKTTKDALSGGPLDSLPSDSIFFLDKSTESVGVPPKRKIEKKREKVLRVDSILQKNAFVQPVPSSTLKKKKKKADKKLNEVDVAASASADDHKANEIGDKKDASLTDIWADEGEGASKAKKKVKPSPIPAVEVEPPGCSFNPDPESHKDTLATAVANEMRKIYQNELGPKPIPLTTVREVIDEEQRYYMDADSGEDEVPAEEGDETAIGTRSATTKRVTRVKLNRRARRKELLRAEAAAKKKKQLSKEIDGISDIMQEIAQEEEEKKKRHIRRVVAKQERLKSCPPRLGKRKFEPAPVQVLLSEEISGSLRKLQGCCTLARDRFKSLEKRGLVVPSAKSRKL